MVLSGARKTSMIASTTNQTSIFGVMGGLAPNGGRKRFMFRSARNRQNIPLRPDAGLSYMERNGLLSTNPTGSGGVGLTRLLVDRSLGPCNCAGRTTAAPHSPQSAETNDLKLDAVESLGSYRLTPDPVGLAHQWFEQVVALNYKTGKTSHKYICNDSFATGEICREAMEFKYKSCGKVSALTRPLEGKVVGEEDYDAGAALFRDMVTWENFVANAPGLMAEYVESCDQYRDPNIKGIVPPPPPDLSVEGYPATWASATSSIGDFGIAVAILHAQGRSSDGADEHALLKILLIGVFQQMYLDYEGSSLKNYSANYPPSTTNPAIAKSQKTSSALYMCNTNIPTFLWVVWSWAMHQLRKDAAAASKIASSNSALVKSYTEYVSKKNMDAAEKYAAPDGATLSTDSEEDKAQATITALISSLRQLDKTIKAFDPDKKYVDDQLEPRVEKMIRMQITSTTYHQGVEEFVKLMLEIVPPGSNMMTAVRNCLSAFTSVDADWTVVFGLTPDGTTCSDNEKARCEA